MQAIRRFAIPSGILGLGNRIVGVLRRSTEQGEPDEEEEKSSMLEGIRERLPEIEWGVWGKRIGIVIGILIAIIALGAIGVAATQGGVNLQIALPVIFAPSAVGSANATGVNVRVAPDVVSQSIGTLQEGQVFTIVGRDQAAKWLRVHFDGNPTDYWIASEFVTSQVPFTALPIDDNQRIVEWFYPLVFFALIWLLIDRLAGAVREWGDLVLLTLAYILVFTIRIDPSDRLGPTMQFIVAFLLVAYACLSGKFDLTPGYYFAGAIAATIAFMGNMGNLAFAGEPAVVSRGFAFLAVGIAIVELGYENFVCNKVWRMWLVALPITAAVALMSFLGVFPIFIALAIVCAAVIVPTIWIRREGSPRVLCNGWKYVSPTGDKAKQIVIAPDIAGLAVMLVILCSI